MEQIVSAEETHDENSLNCWCQPEIHCAICWSLAACLHGAAGSEERIEIIVHRAAS